MKITIVAISLLLSFGAFAQPGWNWPEDPEMESMAKEKQAYYKLLIAQSKHKEAMAPLNWLYANNPNLNQSIYIQGVDCLDAMLKTEKDESRKAVLQDSILWMFDKRIEHFENDASAMDRKAYKAFQMFYKKPSKFSYLAELYEQAYEMNGPEISPFNLNTYMLLAKNYHKSNPSEMPAEKVLSIHTQISDIIDEKKKNGESAERLDKEQSKTDAWLSSIKGILTCDFIEENLVPRFRENPDDIGNAKKIFKYSVQAKCTDKAYWLEASETVFKSQPSLSLAMALGGKYTASGDLAKGMEYYEEAANMAASSDEKHDALMGQASAASKMGQKTKARSLAYEALSAKPGSSRAYNLIGNLYFTSFDICKGEKSQVLDRGVFLAAYEMYEKAGNSSQMTACKEQFPSISDIFNESYEEGQTITVGCWINQSVKVSRR